MRCLFIAHRLLRSDLGRFLDQIKRSSESLWKEGTAVGDVYVCRLQVFRRAKAKVDLHVYIYIRIYMYRLYVL